MRPSLRALAALTGLFLGCGRTTAPAPRSPAQSPEFSPPASATAAPTAAPQVFADIDTEYVFADPDRRKKLESTFPAIATLAEAAVRQDGSPGLVLGVVIDGDLAFAKGFGFADIEKKTQPGVDTVYRIGSITKSFTALALLSLRDQGVLSLDDPLTRFIPEASALVYPTRDAPVVTLRHLLSHTSGLPGETVDYTQSREEPTEEQVVRSLSGLPLETAPGTRWSYSNIGFGLLGIVVGRAAHASLRDVVQTKILKPLGMTSTTFDEANPSGDRIAPPYKKNAAGALERVPNWRFGAVEGAGGISTTLRDLGRYVAFQLGAYPPRGAQEAGEIRRSSIRESHFNLVSTGFGVTRKDAPEKGESIVAATTFATGYGWGVSSTCDFDKIVRHGGGSAGYTAQVSMLPEQGVGVIVLRNLLDDRTAWPDVLVNKVLLALKKSGGLSKRVARPKLGAGFALVMPRVLALYNTWDDAAYASLQSARHRIQMSGDNERAEFAFLKRLHGACKGYDLENLMSPFQAQFTLHCERGALEMEVRLDSIDGLLNRHINAVSQGVPAEAELAHAADRLTALIAKWDESVFVKYLAPKNTKTREETVALFDSLRAGHGSCAVKSFKRLADAEDLSTGLGATLEREQFGLGCERNGGLLLELELDDKNHDVVAKYEISADGHGTCPLKE